MCYNPVIGWCSERQESSAPLVPALMVVRKYNESQIMQKSVGSSSAMVHGVLESEIGQRGDFEWCFTLASTRVGRKWTIIFSALFPLFLSGRTDMPHLYAHYIIICSHCTKLTAIILFLCFLFYFIWLHMHFFHCPV